MKAIQTLTNIMFCSINVYSHVHIIWIWEE